MILERSGEEIATSGGPSGVLFGATVLSATILPDLLTGLTSAEIGDYQLAMSDIFGGNAFLLLFLHATLLSGQVVLPRAQDANISLTELGGLLTTIYLYGLIFRPWGQLARMGQDSLAVLVLYLLGVGGLVAIACG